MESRHLCEPLGIREWPPPGPGKPPANYYLLGCALVAALGGLLFGFDTAVISGTTDALRTRFALSDNLLGFTVASALIGTIIGAFGAGRPADAIGRRGALESWA